MNPVAVGVVVLIGSVFSVLICMAFAKRMFGWLRRDRADGSGMQEIRQKGEWTALYEEGQLSYKEMQALVGRQSVRGDLGQKDPPPAWEDD